MTTSSILENIHAVENSMKNIVNNLKESIDDNEYHEIVMKMNSNIYCNNIEANATTDASLRFKNEDSINFDGIAWFPKKLSDFDLCSNNVIADADELAPNHPGLNDATYRERRKYFSDLARSYKYGQPLPKIEYTETEMKTWRTVFHELKKLHPTHACKEYLMNMNLLEKFCGYNEDNIPQIREVNKFLKELTGFQLRPVAGFLSAREFLAGLAFRLFHCTLYVRHHSDPSYTPEPDCCHELLGHVPLLADLSFSQFSQEIGLASLGASEEEVKKLASCYFFSVEFGLCKQDGEIRAYGAGLLSCFAELKHALSGNSEIRPFDPPKVVQAECNITTFQNAYFYTDSFEDAKDKMRKFVSTIKRPFSVRYNPYTERMDILSNAHEIINVVNELNGDLSIISHALQKIEGIQLQEIEKTV